MFLSTYISRWGFEDRCVQAQQTIHIWVRNDVANAPVSFRYFSDNAAESYGNILSLPETEESPVPLSRWLRAGILSATRITFARGIQ